MEKCGLRHEPRGKKWKGRSPTHQAGAWVLHRRHADSCCCHLAALPALLHPLRGFKTASWCAIVRQRKASRCTSVTLPLHMHTVGVASGPTTPRRLQEPMLEVRESAPAVSHCCCAKCCYLLPKHGSLALLAYVYSEASKFVLTVKTRLADLPLSRMADRSTAVSKSRQSASCPAGLGRRAWRHMHQQ